MIGRLLRYLPISACLRLTVCATLLSGISSCQSRTKTELSPTKGDVAVSPDSASPAKPIPDPGDSNIERTGRAGLNPQKPLASPADPNRSATAKAEQPEDNSSYRGKILFKNTTYDFGKSTLYDMNDAIFEFENIGEETLKVTQVEKCCGAAIRLENAILAPGETSKLIVKYTAGNTGVFQKKVYLSCTDPNAPRTVLTVKGNVLETLTWEPQQLKLFLNKKNGGARAFKIRALDNLPFAITKILVTGDCMTFDFDPNEKALEHVLMPIVDMNAVVAQDPPRGHIQFFMDRPDHQLVRFFYDLLPNHVLNPPQIFIFNADPDRKERRKVSVLDNYVTDANELDFKIERVSVRDASVTILSQDPLRDGYQLLLEIQPPTPKPGSSSFSDEILIKLDKGSEHKVLLRGFYAQDVLMKARQEATADSTPKTP